MASSAAQYEWHVAGDGAIGMALAYRLHHHDERVVLLSRERQDDPAELLYEPFGESVVKWSCPTMHQPEGCSIQRFLVTTKAYSVMEVIERWSPVLQAGARVYFLQNGAGFLPDDALPASAVPLFVVNGGFTAFRAERRHVVQTSMKPVWIGNEAGAPVPTTASVEADLRVLDKVGFHARWTADIARYRWEKICINAIVNAQAVIHETTNGGLLENDQARLDIRSMCDELDPLLAAMSIDLSVDHLHEATIALLRATATNVSSTLQDYRRGSTRHELDRINLVLLEQARSLGIDMPVHEDVHARVTGLFDRGNRG